MPGLTIDGFDLSTIGVVVRRDVQGMRGTPEFTWPTTQIPGRTGALRLSSRPRISPKTLSIPCAASRNVYADARAAIREVVSRLEPHRNRDVLVEFPDEVNAKRVEARMLGVSGQHPGPDFLTPRVDFSIRLEAHDPRIRDASLTSLSLSTTATDTPLGTAPVSPVTTVDGTASGVDVVYEDSGGTEVARLKLSGVTQQLTIDHAAQTIEDANGNNLPGRFEGGEFFELDPADGDEPNSVWPQVRLTAGGGSIEYRKAWWL